MQTASKRGYDKGESKMLLISFRKRIFSGDISELRPSPITVHLGVMRWFSIPNRIQYVNAKLPVACKNTDVEELKLEILSRSRFTFYSKNKQAISNISSVL